VTERIEDLVDWARKLGAEEVGFYCVIGSARIVIPISLTEDELPAPEPESLPPPADPRPESRTDPAE
jgi:hypothetical protein